MKLIENSECVEFKKNTIKQPNGNIDGESTNNQSNSLETMNDVE